MPMEAISAYNDALARLAAAREQVGTIPEAIRKRWVSAACVKFSNTGEIQFPASVMLTSGPYVDASSLPDGMRIAKTVADYQQAIEDAKHRYEAIPVAFRSAVSAPPSH